MRYLSWFMLATSLSFSGLGYSSEEPCRPAVVIEQVQGNNAFALDLYANVKSKKTGNLFISPYSVSSALAMTSMGAREETKKEIDKVFHFNPDAAALASSFSMLNHQITTSQYTPAEFPQLNIANGMWMQVETPFVPEFVDVLEKQFKSGIYALNFAENPEDSRQEINTWVEDRTQGKIKGLFPAGSINEGTHLVLASAVYMKAPWKIQFNEENTTHDSFYYQKDQFSLVEMMNTISTFKFLEKEEFAVVELPYGLEKGSASNLAMLVFLPKEVDGLHKFEQQMNAKQVQSWIQQMSDREVQVRLPKFKLESDVSLSATLAEMGMPLAFSDAADFSGITGNADTMIDSVIHKAFIEVSEKGTEAAAATGVAMTLCMMNDVEYPYYFSAEHPFVFMIVDKTTDSILFMGRIVKP